MLFNSTLNSNLSFEVNKTPTSKRSFNFLKIIADLNLIQIKKDRLKFEHSIKYYSIFND